MKILNKLLILFTSVLSLAVLSAASVFMTAPKAHQQGLSADLSAFTKIQIPSIKPSVSQNVSVAEASARFGEIKNQLTVSYQAAAFAYYKESATVENFNKEVTALNKNREINIRPMQVAQAAKKVEFKASFTKIENNNGQLNNEELVKHYGFSASIEMARVSWAANYESLNVAGLMDELNDQHKLSAVKEDQVKVAAASLEKEALDENWEDEMVFIDYSKPQQEDQENLSLEMTTQPDQTIASLTDHMEKTQDIPDSVLSVINREMDKRQAVPTKATINIDSQALAMASPQNTKDASSMMAAPAPKSSEYSRRPSTSQWGRTVNTLSIYEANIEGVNTQKELRNFEFNSEVLSTQRLTDNVSGKIIIEERLNGSHSIARGTFLKHGYMRTKIDLVLEEGRFVTNVPMLSQDQLGNFLDIEGLVARGAYLLVKMPRTANSIEIDRTYEAKIFLTRDFKVVEQEDDYEYVFFVGVSPGNVLMTYSDFRGQKAQKITHLVEDEVFYDEGSFVQPQKLRFQLSQRNLLGTQSSAYNLYPDQISYFNSEIESQQEAVATYSLITPIKPQGSRNYLEIKSGRMPMFVGLWNHQEVELPSETFASYVLESHQLSNLENACMVQINIQKPIEDVIVYGETQLGQMGIIKTYLDKDGQFNYEPSQMASHIFLVGDTQGLISLKVTYSDSSSDILKTFCSDNTYLVEQL